MKATLLRNLKICDRLAMLTSENLAKLKCGNAPTMMRGPYSRQIAEVDHIVPLAEAAQIGNELANLKPLPATLNRAKNNRVGKRQLRGTLVAGSTGKQWEVGVCSTSSDGPQNWPHPSKLAAGTNQARLKSSSLVDEPRPRAKRAGCSMRMSLREKKVTSMLHSHKHGLTYADRPR